MATDGTGEPREDGRAELRAFLFWTLAAALLRFCFLGRWSLWGDEAYSYINARELWTPEASPSLKVYPLFFVLEWGVGLVTRWRGSLEWTLRFVPALAGSLAVGVLYLAPRGILERRVRHGMALLAVASPWLLFHSQFARFYSLLLLLSAAAAFAFLRAVRENSRRQMAWATLLLALAVLTHPTAVLLLAGLLTGAVLLRLGGTAVRWRTLAPLLALGVVFAGVLLLRIEDVDQTVGFKILQKDPGADSLADLARGMSYNLGLSVCVLAALGMLLLLRTQPGLFLFVAAGAGVPVAAVAALSLLGSSVEQRYLIPVVPLCLVPAAALLDHLVQATAARVRGARALVPLLAVLPFGPGVASHYRDGNRHDLRAAAQHIAAQLEPEDLVVSENHYLMSLYLPELEEERLVEAPPQFGRGFDEYLDALEWARRLWVVMPSDFLELGGDREAFYRWAWSEGHLERELYVPRFDYHQNRLEVFLVDLDQAERWRPVEDRSVRDEPRLRRH